MDEPLSNLDASLRVKTRTEIKRLQRELKITVVFVTHDQEEAMVMSDRIAVMNNGVLQQFDEPMKIYRAPMNVFVAGFIGSPQMNLLPGDTAPGDTARDASSAAPSRSRPDGEWRPDGFTLKGELALIEPAGPLHYLDVDVGGQTVKATCADPSGLFPGAAVTLSAQARQCTCSTARAGCASTPDTSKNGPMAFDLILRNGRVIDPSQILTASLMSPSLAERWRRSASASIRRRRCARRDGPDRHAGPHRSAHSRLLGRHVARH